MSFINTTYPHRKIDFVLKSLAILLALFLHTLSCRHDEQVAEPIEAPNPLMTWYKEYSNPKDPHYLEKFKQQYEHYRLNKQYDSCGKLLVSVGNALYANSMSDSTFLYYSLDYFKHFDLPRNKILHHALANMVASHYFNLNQNDSAKKWYRKGMNNGQQRLLQKANAFACSELGNHFLFESKMDSAEHYYRSAIRSFEAIKDTTNLVVNYNTLSAMFQGLHAWNLAERYVDIAYPLAKASKDTEMMIGSMNMKAYIHYTGLKDTGRFIKLVDSSMIIYNQYRQRTLYSQFIQNNMLFEQALSINNSDKAAIYLQQCDSLNKTMQNGGMQIQINAMRFAYFAASKQSIPDEKDAVNLANHFEASDQLVMAFRLFQTLAQNAALNKDTKAELMYTRAGQRCNEKLFVQNQKGQLFELEKKYENEKKEKQIQIQQMMLTESKFKISLLLFLLSGVVLVALAFFAYKKQREARTEITRQQVFTDALLQNTEEERKRIATELHDGVNHELLTLKNNVTSGQAVSAQAIEGVIEEVRQVSRDLYPAMFENIGLALSIESLCHRLSESGLFTTCEINYHQQLPKTHELQLYRLIQEALNNTRKHAQANAARVSILATKGEVTTEIKDNGIGFDIASQLNNSNAFGIQSILQRARAIHARSSFESDSNGTRILLSIPYA